MTDEKLTNDYLQYHADRYGLMLGRVASLKHALINLQMQLEMCGPKDHMKRTVDAAIAADDATLEHNATCGKCLRKVVDGHAEGCEDKGEE